jgi:hypothetical protein
MIQVSFWRLVRECPSQLAQLEMAVLGGCAIQPLPKTVIGIIETMVFA